MTSFLSGQIARKLCHCVDDLTGPIDNCELTSGTVTGVEAHNGLAAERRLHKKVLEVVREEFDRAFGSVIKKIVSYLALNRGRDKSFISVNDSVLHILLCGAGLACYDKIK